MLENERQLKEKTIAALEQQVELLTKGRLYAQEMEYTFRKIQALTELLNALR